MPARPRHYRKKPLAVFEHGTRINTPPPPTSPASGSWPPMPAGRGYSTSSRARTTLGPRPARLEAYLADRTPWRSSPDAPRTVAALAKGYLEHLGGRSLRYRERQEALLRCWVLPHLGQPAVSRWTPALSEAVLSAARQRLAPSSVQSLGSCLRSLVTLAHKSRWLPRDVDPMWQVGYSARAKHQGQAVGFVHRSELPNDTQCEGLFAALVELGQPTWALAMRLAHRCGARWGELVALTPAGVEDHVSM